MNHEPAASAAAESHSHTGPDSNANSVPARSSNARAVLKERATRNRLLFNKKRELFLATLIRNVDMLVYAELAAVYYMDCSFWRFLMRGFVQFLFLTPKPAFLPEPPENRSFVGVIFGTNLLCIIIHLFSTAPDAGEPTRGYLHGGLAIDFIGQKGPASAVHLLLLDLLLLALQLVNTAATVTRRRVKSEVTNPNPNVPVAAPQQDHDYEERGLHASHQDPVNIELHSLNPDGGQEHAETQSAETQSAADQSNQESEALLESTAPRSDAHIFDAFNSGEIIIADLNIAGVVRSQFMEYRNPPPHAPAPAAGLHARLANNGLTFRFRIGDRIVGF